MKTIFKYYDYQKFLRDFYEEKKQENPNISFRYLGNRMNLDPGFLLKVIQGKHHLAKRSIAQICTFFKFSELESQYFEILVSYGKAKTNSDIKLYFEQLMALREPESKQIEEAQYAFYQKWYHSAIHALLSIYEFKGSYKKLSTLLSPSITTQQAKESIQLLVNTGMIKRGEDGVYRPTDHFITTGQRWTSAAIHNFQKETIALSAESLDLHPKELRDISTVTVTISSKDLPEIRERIKQLRQSILSLYNENNGNTPDTVYQINIQAFPVSQRIGEDQ
ncbi:MAG: TIGR02147 family protein [Fibrobacter sp.]|nr:TIGR02147 family protein [Fibrobacter sp.]